MPTVPYPPINAKWSLNDIEELYSYLRSLQPAGDNQTTQVDWDAGGFIVRSLEQPTQSELSTVATSGPFQMSIGKDDLDNDVVTISSGNILIESVVNHVPAGYVILNGFAAGSLFIYLKVSQNWFDDNDDVVSIPELTILQNEGDTNFSGNQSLYPNTDEGTFYFPIGEIEISEDGPSFTYSIIEQVANDNAYIYPIDLNGFTLVRFFITKASDTDLDNVINMYCTRGQAQTPDESVILDQQKIVFNKTSTQQVWLLISSTKTDGYYEDFTASIDFTNNPTSTDEDIYYFIGDQVVQAHEGNFLSPSRIW